jgi:hypothetical protein
LREQEEWRGQVCFITLFCLQRDSKFSGLAGGKEGDKYFLLHYFVLFQSFKICWRNGGRGRDKFDRDSKFSGGSWRNGGRQLCFIILFFFISNLQNLLEEWRERDRLNLTETLNSLEGAGGMEGDKFVLLHFFVLFQSSKIFWRNGERGTE